MTIMMNIASVGNMAGNAPLAKGAVEAVNASLGNSSSQTSINSNNFAALIASLLGLSNPEQRNGQQSELAQNKTNNNGQEIIASILDKAGTIKLQQMGNDKNLDNEGDKNALIAIADLLESLEQIANALQNGNEIDKALIDKAIAAINLLSSQLQTIAPSPLGATIAGVSEIYLALNKNDKSPLPSLAQQGLDSAQKAISNNLTQNQIIKAANNIVANLQDFAQKFEQSLPNLSQQINSLISQFSNNGNNINFNNLLAQTNSTQTSINQAGSGQAGLAQAMLDNLTKKTNAQNSQPAVNTSPQIGLNKKTNSNNLSANILANAEKSVNNNIAQQNGAQFANLSNIKPARADNPIQSDPILSVQSNGQTAVISNFNASIKPLTTPYQQPTQNLNLPHIAYEFVSNVRAGISRFQIQLNPPEMGRIDVKMDIDNNGTLNARLSVERVETLDLLQRDARALERALAQAGLDNSKTNLEFSLKDNPFAKNENQFGDNQNNFANGQNDKLENETDTNIINQTPNAIIYRGTASLGGLNIVA